MADFVSLTPSQIAALESHYHLLLKWNSSMNLTTVTGLEEAAVRHYAESLFLGLQISGKSVIDVGSGPGFPGIPIAILHPEWEVTLVESHKRKAVFLREAARGLSNVRIVVDRAEAVRGQFDWVVSRAVDPNSVLKLRLASQFGILVGIEDAQAIANCGVIPLPWGRSRVVVLGQFTGSGPDACST
jgi:16S rRNA (guanine527-N7)-methyltransferase